MKKLLIMTALLSVTPLLEAKVIRQTPVNRIFQNIDCESTDSCDLKEFKISTYDFEVVFPSGSSFGTGAFFTYKTEKVNQLQNYAIVQKIRGCQYTSELEDDGTINKKVDVKREFYDQLVNFSHPTWVIDSVDTDPVYNSGPQDNRHAFYRWNKTPGSTNETGEMVYVRAKPTHPELYVSDFPGTAFETNINQARNISLEFDVCIFKSQDVPFVSTPGTALAVPIACHKWNSSFIFNFQTKRYESPKEIDPFCLN